MRTKTNFRMPMIAMVLVLSTAFQTAQAQQIREYELRFVMNESYNGNSECNGYVVFDAVFDNFATRLSVKNTRLYIVYAGEGTGLIEALDNAGISKKYYSEIGTSAYKIDRFELYMNGYVSIGNNAEFAPFKVQVSNSLGDFCTPEFDIDDKSRFTGDSSWENSGAISPSYPGKFEVTEINFKDLDIRLKD